MSIERPWLASYPKNVPAQIDLDEFGSIPDILTVACKDFADRPAFENMGRTLSYGQIDALSQQFAAYLLHDLKLKKVIASRSCCRTCCSTRLPSSARCVPASPWSTPTRCTPRVS